MCGLQREVSLASVLLGVNEERDCNSAWQSCSVEDLRLLLEPAGCPLIDVDLSPMPFPSGFGPPSPTFQLLGECLLLMLVNSFSAFGGRISTQNAVRQL